MRGDDADLIDPQLFHLRSFAPRAIIARTVEIVPESHHLQSEDCFILKVPFEEGDGSSGMLFIWIGAKASKADAEAIQEIAKFRPWQVCASSLRFDTSLDVPGLAQLSNLCNILTTTLVVQSDCH